MGQGAHAAAGSSSPQTRKKVRPCTLLSCPLVPANNGVSAATILFWDGVRVCCAVMDADMGGTYLVDRYIANPLLVDGLKVDGACVFCALDRAFQRHWSSLLQRKPTPYTHPPPVAPHYPAPPFLPPPSLTPSIRHVV